MSAVPKRLLHLITHSPLGKPSNRFVGLSTTIAFVIYVRNIVVVNCVCNFLFQSAQTRGVKAFSCRILDRANDAYEVLLNDLCHTP